MENLRSELEAIQAAAAHARTLTGREQERAIKAIRQRTKAALGNDPIRNALEQIDSQFSMPFSGGDYLLKVIGLRAQDGLRAADAEVAAEVAADVLPSPGSR